jgi:hypothetical protein
MAVQSQDIKELKRRILVVDDKDWNRYVISIIPYRYRF